MATRTRPRLATLPGETEETEDPPPMLSWLMSGRDRRQVARSLYGSSVTAARATIFYAEWGVPDTLQGRFEMVAMHVALILRRLSATGERGRRLGRALTEAFVVDMDDSMRELTFGAARDQARHGCAL
jgi:cytochrome b pre-mRNA-processing protein 3